MCVRAGRPARRAVGALLRGLADDDAPVGRGAVFRIPRQVNSQPVFPAESCNSSRALAVSSRCGADQSLGVIPFSLDPQQFGSLPVQDVDHRLRHIVAETVQVPVVVEGAEPTVEPVAAGEQRDRSSTVERRP